MYVRSLIAGCLLGAFGSLVAGVSAAQNEVIIRCGASAGMAYFFEGALNPKGAHWDSDGISSGQIILVRNPEGWDIKFDDAVGSFSYRQDGADVVPLVNSNRFATVGVFHSTYTDLYTFDFEGGEVLWSSHKIGAAIPKASLFRAVCVG